ncbi:MAG: hypothetical protein A2287_05725 [Candidatus Melainabacteria bacterium RIFOXYA12_FULL_32_12]|nr:MAG: hypothetical protein A2255_07375 [Candidatus Melainabacteria bacterium RIFOXYA2_FULL_32_9]OGI30746.1 MAG: hypothetical protein A2287_05725 [Candidatus Melainabacteria bacterium RIFOXYA12_FULL_32_12]
MVKIKICGITTLEDASLAAQLGAWAVGFIFYKKSPRYIEPDKAKLIIKELPDNIEKIGVFVDLPLDEIQDIALKTGITQIQLHGNESKDFCTEVVNKINLPVIKAIRIKDFTDLSSIPEYKNIVSAILLDSYSKNLFGGTGESFNWGIAKKAKTYNMPIIIAGGINPDNVANVYTEIQPYALDISSGIEEYKGIKDHNKLKKLFSAVNSIL